MFIDFVGLTTMALLIEQPRHPYDLQRTIRERRWDQAFRVGGMPRSLYHAVDRLARLGLIEPVETSREGNRPERTVYRITDEGREEFHARVRSLLETPVSEQPVVAAALGFIAYLTPGTVLDALESRVVQLASELAGIDASLRALHEEMRLPRQLLIGLECRRALRHAELDWARSVVEELRTGSLTWSWDELGRHFAAEQARREGQGGAGPPFQNPPSWTFGEPSAPPFAPASGAGDPGEEPTHTPGQSPC